MPVICRKGTAFVGGCDGSRYLDDSSECVKCIFGEIDDVDNGMLKTELGIFDVF